MDFTLTDEQQMLRDSARRFCEAEYTFEKRRKHLAAADPAEENRLWSGIAELGWLAAGIPEDLGGLGGGDEALVLILEELGRALVVQPFLANAILSASLLEQGDPNIRAAMLPKLAEGSLRLAFAAYETAGRYRLDRFEAQATRTATGFLLDGRKILVAGGDTAHAFIVAAMLEEAPALFVVEATDRGVTRRAYQTMDEHAVADVAFDSVALAANALLAGPEHALEIVDLAIDRSIVGLCAEALGGMERAIELSVAYMKQRTQFGHPLSDFQVQQHRSADMFIDADSARSLLYAALAALPGPARERKRAVSACKVGVMEAAKRVTGDAIHQHGGMGMTIEYPVGHYYRRVLVAERLFGDAEHHLQRFISLEEHQA